MRFKTDAGGIRRSATFLTFNCFKYKNIFYMTIDELILVRKSLS
jgi:hypothetical protein